MSQRRGRRVVVSAGLFAVLGLLAGAAGCAHSRANAPRPNAVGGGPLETTYGPRLGLRHESVAHDLAATRGSPYTGRTYNPHGH